METKDALIHLTAGFAASGESVQKSVDYTIAALKEIDVAVRERRVARAKAECRAQIEANNV